IAILITLSCAMVRLNAQPSPPAQTKLPAQTTPGNVPAPLQYSLPPDKLQKAVDYARARYWLHFTGELYGIGVLLVVLATGISATFRNWAERVSKRRFIQAVIFVIVFMLVNDVASLPFGVYGQHLERLYEQSIQS